MGNSVGSSGMGKIAGSVDRLADEHYRACTEAAKTMRTALLEATVRGLEGLDRTTDRGLRILGEEFMKVGATWSPFLPRSRRRRSLITTLARDS
jgi:hypothetical protein